MANEYYQSAYTGAQIDNTLGRIIGGEFDNTAENAEIASRSAAIAKEAQAGAEKARDEAVEIVGGDFATRSQFENHLADNYNPHRVTAEQTGALPKSGGEIDGDVIVTGQISVQGLISSDTGITTGGDIITDRNVTASEMYADGYYNGNGKKLTETFTATVTTNWLADGNGGYLQMVEVDGILATDNPIADVVMGDDVAANELYAKAWSCITRIFTEDDMVTLYANKEAPTTAFTMQLKVVR